MYDLLAEQYSALFPPDSDRCSFVIGESKAADDRRRLRILDAGCANGDLAFELCDAGCEVVGIDLNMSMIEQAVNRQKGLPTENLSFLCRSMTAISDLGRFNTITCFGNTLPHLPDIKKTEEFFRTAGSALAAEGRIIFQIINFDSISGREHFNFPDIEAGGSIFKRSYRKREDGRLDFKISLSDKNSGKTVSDSTPLLPLKRENLIEMLTSAGFRNISVYSGYDRQPSDGSEFASIYSAALT